MEKTPAICRRKIPKFPKPLLRFADCQASRKWIYFIGVSPLIWDSGYRRKNSQFSKLLLRFADCQPSRKLIYLDGVFFPLELGFKSGRNKTTGTI